MDATGQSPNDVPSDEELGLEPDPEPEEAPRA